ncbi:hypothetical protein B0H15DRAFT_799999 [Mycena belliarum]|uniref:F-box domain-containing protein n=1 Tax=Mycena belliarum TaxID=1033014 RepID=A0AAD6XRS4_9AGAR|nr:hypothetical protein B0H15DRAFT_799999 [Mycena belliae]
MTAAHDVPSELHDLIIDHMHDDNPALKTCGLVNQAWLCSSRHHLFRGVNVNYQNWEEYLQLAASPLATFPHLVRRLAISDSDHRRYIHDFIARLSVLPALKHLRISDSLGGSAGLNDLRRLFGNITTLEIHKVEFDYFDEMVAYILCFPRLEQVALSPRFVEEEPAKQPGPLVFPRTLHTVRFRSPAHHMTSLVSLLQPVGGPPPISSLELNVLAPPALGGLGALLRALGTELRALDLAFVHHVTPAQIGVHFALAHNPRLERLTLHISLRRFRFFPGAATASAHAPWALLSAVRSPLSALTIVLRLNGLDLLERVDWAFLDAALQTLPQLAALQRLCFNVHCTADFPDDCAIDAALRTRLIADHACAVVVSVVRDMGLYAMTYFDT